MGHCHMGSSPIIQMKKRLGEEEPPAPGRPASQPGGANSELQSPCTTLTAPWGNQAARAAAAVCTLPVSEDSPLTESL